MWSIHSEGCSANVLYPGWSSGRNFGYIALPSSPCMPCRCNGIVVRASIWHSAFQDFPDVYGYQGSTSSIWRVDPSMTDGMHHWFSWWRSAVGPPGIELLLCDEDSTAGSSNHVHWGWGISTMLASVSYLEFEKCEEPIQFWTSW